MRKIYIKSVCSAVLLFTLFTNGMGQVTNGQALVPPMGWNSWNKFGPNISDAMIRQIADAMVSSGMAAAGYNYVNLDDGWQNLGRNASGHVLVNTGKFPNGMKALGDYIHTKGLKFGVYSDHGLKTCQGLEGSYMHETTDANDYAAWGVDYLKYDNCNLPSGDNSKADYERMRDALKASGRPIAFSICAWEFLNWMPNTGNLWRTTGDIYDSWSSMMSNYDINIGLPTYAKPGFWNDPDMLEIGNGGMTDTEYRTHMSLWCIMAAPLITGNDVRSMSAATKAILMAPELIAVDQDSLGKQGVKVRDDGNYEVISKQLKGTNVRAVALLNRSGSASTIKVSWSEIGLPAGKATVRDLWAQKDMGSFASSYTVSVPSHGTAMLKIKTDIGISVPSMEDNPHTVSLYPNPCNGVVNLVFNTNEVSEVSLSVYDVSGRRMMSTITLTNAQHTLDVTALSKGLYFVEVCDKNKNTVQRMKLIKQ